jgi:hypothetical protein
MTEPNHWEDLCQSSTDSHIEEQHKIDSLWPTFEPKDLFQDYYQSSPAKSTKKNSPSVSFADPVATIVFSEGAILAKSEGANQIVAKEESPAPPSMPPEILQPIHTQNLSAFREPSINLLLPAWHC